MSMHRQIDTRCKEAKASILYSSVLLSFYTYYISPIKIGHGHLKIWMEDLKPFFLSWKPVGICKNGTNVV